MSAQAQPQAAAQKRHLHGVKGWLFCAIAIFLAIKPLAAWGGLVAYLKDYARHAPFVTTLPQWRLLEVVVTLATIASMSLSIFAGVKLLTKFKKTSVYFAVVTLWLTGPALVGAGHIAAVSIIGGIIELSPARPILYIKLASVFAALWTMYLLFSRRVRNTYFRNEPD